MKSLTTRLNESKGSYEDLFWSLMKKYNVESPAELSTEKKKDFFNELEKEWDKIKSK